MSVIPRLSIRPKVDVKSTAADKGKGAEVLVTDWLNKRQQGLAGFAFHRMPDAKAARGPLAAQPADFIVSCRGEGGAFLEVKECAEQYRLPKDRISQYGKLLAFHLAGMPSFVLVRRTLTKDWLLFSSDSLMSPEARQLKSFTWDMGERFDSLDSALGSLF